MINTNLSGQTNFRYYFIVWGFPCVVMLIIALLAAMRIGAQFGSSTIAEIGIFLITFLLQFLVYQAVFQQLPLYLCQLIFQEFELRARKSRQMARAATKPRPKVRSKKLKIRLLQHSRCCQRSNTASAMRSIRRNWRLKRRSSLKSFWTMSTTRWRASLPRKIWLRFAARFCFGLRIPVIRPIL